MLDLETIGHRLARTDKHLLETLGVRVGEGSLSDCVAACKRPQDGGVPNLTRKVVEDQRLAQVATWAQTLGVDPDFAAAIFYAIIAESCKEQMTFLHRHSGDKVIDQNDPDAMREFYREQLLQLTQRVAATYDKDYARGFSATSAYLRFEKMELGRLVADLEDRELALDLGCATGINSVRLAESFRCVVGYDISPDMLEQANQRLSADNANSSRISFELTDLEKGIPQPDSSVSLVVTNMGTGSDIEGIDQLLRETKRVLRPDGAFLFSFYNAGSLLAKLGFLPWRTSLAALVDPDRRCLEVRVGNEVFFIHARPYSVSEIERIFMTNGLAVSRLLTYPTVSAVLPPDILVTETFESFDDQQDPQRRHRNAKMKVEDNQPAKKALVALDEELARSPLNLGAYILVTGGKYM